MEKINDKVRFTDDKGNVTELSILFTWFNKDNNKNYVFFFDDDMPDEIIAGYLNENNEILDIEDDDEYDVLDEVLDSFLKEQDKK